MALSAGTAHAATDLDPCLHIARPADPAGAAQWAAWWHGLDCLIPANAGTWAPKTARVTRPKPRPCVPLPVCLLPEMPAAFRWEPGLGGSQPGSEPREAGLAYLPAPRASAIPAIPLPASGLLLAAALALLWRARR